MSDNKQNVGKPDRNRINLSEEYEVSYWTKKFNVSEERLKEAVKKAGSMSKDVEAFLKK